MAEDAMCVNNRLYPKLYSEMIEHQKASTHDEALADILLKAFEKIEDKISEREHAYEQELKKLIVSQINKQVYTDSLSKIIVRPLSDVPYKKKSIPKESVFLKKDSQGDIGFSLLRNETLSNIDIEGCVFTDGKALKIHCKNNNDTQKEVDEKLICYIEADTASQYRFLRYFFFYLKSLYIVHEKAHKLSRACVNLSYIQTSSDEHPESLLDDYFLFPQRFFCIEITLPFQCVPKGKTFSLVLDSSIEVDINTIDVYANSFIAINQFIKPLEPLTSIDGGLHALVTCAQAAKNYSIVDITSITHDAINPIDVEVLDKCGISYLNVPKHNMPIHFSIKALVHNQDSARCNISMHDEVILQALNRSWQVLSKPSRFYSRVTRLDINNKINPPSNKSELLALIENSALKHDEKLYEQILDVTTTRQNRLVHGAYERQLKLKILLNESCFYPDAKAYLFAYILHVYLQNVFAKDFILSTEVLFSSSKSRLHFKGESIVHDR